MLRKFIGVSLLLISHFSFAAPESQEPVVVLDEDGSIISINAPNAHVNIDSSGVVTIEANGEMFVYSWNSFNIAENPAITTPNPPDSNSLTLNRAIVTTPTIMGTINTEGAILTSGSGINLGGSGNINVQGLTASGVNLSDVTISASIIGLPPLNPPELVIINPPIHLPGVGGSIILSAGPTPVINNSGDITLDGNLTTAGLTPLSNGVITAVTSPVPIPAPFVLLICSIGFLMRYLSKS